MIQIHTQPDREIRDAHAAQEAAEVAEVLRPKGMFEGVQTVGFKAGAITLEVSEGAVLDQDLPPAVKLRLERYERGLAEKAQVRQETCWMSEGYGCKGRAMLHVQEVQFDLRQADATPRTSFVSSSDYPGPVPGFCLACAASGPKVLAEAVYRSRPEMQWGFRPNRWFVKFTDGSKQGGLCQEIDMHHIQPKFIENHMSPHTNQE